MTNDLQLLDQLLRQYPYDSLWCADENVAGYNPPGFNGAIISNRFDVVDLLIPEHPHASFSDFDLSTIDFSHIQTVIFRIAKEKAVNLHIISQAFYYLKKGGKLILIGYKNEGMNSLVSKIKSSYQCDIAINKHKSQLQLVELTTFGEQNTPLADEPYNDLQTLTIDDTTFITKPGVFGWNKIDKGSKILMEVLAETLAIDPTLEIIDLGCGYGFLSIQAKLLGYTHIDATDNNAAAINACINNFDLYDIEGEVVADNHAQHLQKRYDLVLCNPPFHKGFDHEKNLTEVFTHQAYTLLKPGGQAFFVTNQFIGIEKIAKKLFSAVDLLHQKDGFKVYLFKK